MIAWLQSIRVRSQVFAALVVVPVVLALLGLSLVPQVLAVVLADDVDPGTLRLAVHAVRYAVAVVVTCGFVTAMGAAALLRSSIRTSVDSIRSATEALAAGDFEHRIHSRRTDELGSLARAVDTTAARLGRLEQARRQMLACVSHELRTPLTIARNTAYTLARSAADRATADRFALLDDELGHLGSLVGDLIDAASIHAGGVRLASERVDLVDLVHDAAQRFRDAASERSIRLDVEASAGDRRRCRVDADVDRLHQILGNLLTNAVRHGRAGSTISLELRPGARDGGVHEVRVSNRGEMIPRDFRSAIFEPFVQHGDRPGRVGLGLCIARDLAEAHGGELQLDDEASAEADGAVFVLRLPAAAAPVRAEFGARTAPSARRLRYAT